MLAPFGLNKKILRDCEIYKMLCAANKRRHLSFHTPGHKRKGFDVTELSFSDNLSAPTGCIRRAEEDIARILGAEKAFICTDGSTCGVLSILYAAREAGVKKVACPQLAHKSFFNGCKLLGLEAVEMPARYAGKIPLPPTEEDMRLALESADALFLTSPDYYGNIPALAAAKGLCEAGKKLLLIDGAHGGHLHFERTVYAGTYADLWVDGVHKSLPAYTQGAVVCAQKGRTDLANKLQEGLDIFRTTSPSYPIMASIEYAVKFPRARRLEEAVAKYVLKNSNRFYFGGDWTKLCFWVGDLAFSVKENLEKKGIYPEFCDGNVLLFYLSPAVKMRQFKRLQSALNKWIARLNALEIVTPEKTVRQDPAPLVFEKYDKNGGTEWVELNAVVGRVCAKACGLFPPCLPLLSIGEKISESKVKLLKRADGTFGLKDGKICVFAEATGQTETEKEE